jgi:hypothetical protein
MSSSFSPLKLSLAPANAEDMEDNFQTTAHQEAEVSDLCHNF